MNFVHKFALVFCAGFVMANPAVAAQKLAIYTGLVLSGTDETGLFLAPGTNLANQAFTAVVDLDIALGRRITTPDSDRVEGGFFFGLSNPVNSVTVTIAGRDFVFSPNRYSFAEQTPFLTSTYGGYLIQTGPQQEFEIEFLNYVSGPTLKDLNQNFSLNTNFSDGFLGIKNIDLATSTTTFDLLLVLRPSSLVYGVVPEPSSWLMLLTGFGLLGGRLRYNRRRTPVEQSRRPTR